MFVLLISFDQSCCVGIINLWETAGDEGGGGQRGEERGAGGEGRSVAGQAGTRGFVLLSSHSLAGSHTGLGLGSLVTCTQQQVLVL